MLLAELAKGTSKSPAIAGFSDGMGYRRSNFGVKPGFALGTLAANAERFRSKAFLQYPWPGSPNCFCNERVEKSPSFAETHAVRSQDTPNRRSE